MANRPTKICPVCGRPFQCPKKVEERLGRVGAFIGSDRCRNNRKRLNATGGLTLLDCVRDPSLTQDSPCESSVIWPKTIVVQT